MDIVYGMGQRAKLMEKIQTVIEAFIHQVLEVYPV